VEYDDQDGLFVGKIAGIRDGVGFHADNVPDLKRPSRKPSKTTWTPVQRSARRPTSPTPAP
jgi:predicted HicB family RNase H-like nuclease